MNAPPPSLRLHTPGVSTGLSASFYLPYAHSAVATAVLQSLEVYQRTVGTRVLTTYEGEDGEWRPLDSQGWAEVHRGMQEEPWANVHLSDASLEASFRFDYLGRERVDVPSVSGLGEVSAVSFWLPTEYLERHGPRQTRELLMALAAPLPFSSGNAGLAFNGALDVAANIRQVRRDCLRYPGLDVLRLGMTSLHIGTRVRAPSWLTFLGAPVLSQLGGAAQLRSRINAPSTTVQTMEATSAVVTLGDGPTTGDSEHGESLSGYRELARILEPWTLWGEGESILGLTPEAARRWERRFLD